MNWMSTNEVRKRMQTFFGDTANDLTDQECFWIENQCKDLFYCSGGRHRKFNFIRHDAQHPRFPKRNVYRRFVNLPRGGGVVEY